ncbi:MAG: GNAT family N-acetyltransferase [Saprospiraceae bacterium]
MIPTIPVTIRTEMRPGDFGAIVYLHGVLYAQEQGFDTTFEAYVAEPLAQFVLHKNERSHIWIIENENGVKGCIAIVECSAQEAQLRWFILHPELRGWGLGKKLINEALQFCRDKGYASVHLLTISALHTAAALYKAAGFKRIQAKESVLWGVPVLEEKYELIL